VKDQDWMPKEEGIDHTAGLIREGYMYVPNRMKSYQTNVFETKVLGQKAICISGKEAAALFYDTEKFERSGAAPQRVLKTLFGRDGVQTLDGEEHRHRKEMFMSLMSKERLEALRSITRKRLSEALDDWMEQPKITLFHEAKKLMTRIACEWAGVPLFANEWEARTKQLANLFENAATIGIKYRQTVSGRTTAEKWMKSLVEQVREGELHPEQGTALHTMSWHRELKGELMDLQTTAVELLNILRPIVAISIFINFTALAVYQYPEETKKLEDGDDSHFHRFIQEVRRFYPFFPFLPAKVRHDFQWKQFQFEKDTLVLLDLYGTNHDPNIWDNPSLFQPDRFCDWSESPFDFIPQGGGDYWMGHRCAGEWVTVEIMKIVLDFLANKMEFNVPPQDLSYSMVNIPSIPKSEVIINKIRRSYK